MPSLRFTVELKLPRGASHQDALHYVQEAVRTHRGGLEPPVYKDGPEYLDGVHSGDPMFGLDPDSVSVRKQMKR